MATTEQWRKQYAKYKEDVKKRGKPFYPYAMFEDTVMSLVVVSVIIGLAAVWYYTSGEDPKTCGSGDSCLLGPRYSEPADPGTTNFVPRPDWYFYFLFYLLRIFKWPDSVILGTVGIPTLLLIIALLLPFFDRRMERRLTRRPVAVIAAVLVVISMGVLTYKGATAKEALASELTTLPQEWAKKQGFEGNKDAIAGATLFTQAGCLTCHTYLGTGSSNLGAPDLSNIGTKGLGIETQIKHLKDPGSVTPGSPMPSFAQLGDENLRKLAVFLEASKGGG